MGYHLVSVVRGELDQIIMALCRIFDVIKQSSTLYECDMTDCLLSKVYATLGQASSAIIFLWQTIRDITLLQG
jgi:hypothetical protein